MKSIIMYYSRSGNTGKLANRIKNDIGCEIIKIEPEEAYGNYVSSVIKVMGEKIKKEAPAFKTTIPDLSQYDVIFIGYPVWGQDIPMFVSDFLSKCNIVGKKVIPFATYGMTSISWTMKSLKANCQGAEILYPFSQGVVKKDNYDEWIKKVKDILK